MRRLPGIALVLLTATACTPEQITAWSALNGDDHPVVIEHVIRSAAAEFGVDGDLMVAIADCESHLNPTARNASSGASGLFQHLARYWPGRAAAVGQPDAPWWDPVANSRAAALMLAEQGTRPWSPSRYCWS